MSSPHRLQGKVGVGGRRPVAMQRLTKGVGFDGRRRRPYSNKEPRTSGKSPWKRGRGPAMAWHGKWVLTSGGGDGGGWREGQGKRKEKFVPPPGGSGEDKGVCRACPRDVRLNTNTAQFGPEIDQYRKKPEYLFVCSRALDRALCSFSNKPTRPIVF